MAFDEPVGKNRIGPAFMRRVIAIANLPAVTNPTTADLSFRR
jgi:hypothetical protein